MIGLMWLFYYLISRCEILMIMAGCWIGATLSFGAICLIIYAVNYDTRYEGDARFRDTSVGYGKKAFKYIWIPVLLLVLVPNKQDALITAGLAVGGQVVLAAGDKLTEIEKSETMSKVVDLVNAKVDKMLKDATDAQK